MLHTHRTGCRYYVLEDTKEVANATMAIWNTETVCSPSPPLLSSPPLLTTPTPFVTSPSVVSSSLSSPSLTQTILTPKQHNYISYIGDWQCLYCHNINFACHTECK